MKFRINALSARPRRAAGLIVASLAFTATFLVAVNRTAADPPNHDERAFSNAHGVHRTVSTKGSIDLDNPFFKDLGTNGRTCLTCHRPAQAWSITPQEVRARFEATQGTEAIFRTNDGSNCEGADVSTVRRRRDAFSLLLTKGLIRVGLQVPADAEFEIVDVDDPYRCGALFTAASVYRRPLPTTNLAFLSAIMWDGRESHAGHAIATDLMTQAMHATTGHAEGAPPSEAELKAIVDFQLSLFTAQSQATPAGSLRAQGARGGARALSTEPFCVGINDPLGMLPAMPGACPTVSAGFNPEVFTLFGRWEDAGSRARRSIARGQAIFNTRPFVINDVGGLNAGPDDPVAGPITGGTCTICHDTPNVGNHSVAMALNIGIADEARRTDDLPLYTLRRKTTADVVKTSDPGRAMITGKWSDIGKFKGPILRALAARPPYFHDGSAATLEAAVEFYNTRFRMGLSSRDKADLAAFLAAL